MKNKATLSISRVETLTDQPSISVQTSFELNLNLASEINLAEVGALATHLGFGVADAVIEEKDEDTERHPALAFIRTLRRGLEYVITFENGRSLRDFLREDGTFSYGTMELLASGAAITSIDSTPF